MAVTTVPKVTGVHDATGGVGSQYATLGVGVAVASAEIVAVTASGTIASGASAVWNGVHVNASTATISGSTNITTANGFNLIQIERPTLTSGSAVVVTNAATLTIINSPLAAGSTTITNPYSVWVQAGISRFDGVVYGANGAIGAPSYSFVSDPDTGLYWAASGVMRFTVNGADTVSISTGAVICNSFRLDYANADVVLTRGAANHLYLASGDSMSVGAAAIASGTHVVQVASGTPPTGQTADSVSFYSSDNSAGNTIPSFYCEGTEVLATGQADSVSSVRVKVRINGTVVTLLAI